MKANDVTFVCANCGSTDINVQANGINNSSCVCGAHIGSVPRAPQVPEVPTANGIPAEVLAVLQRYSDSLPVEMLNELAAVPGGSELLGQVAQDIVQGGYIDSPVIVRRWVNAQLFALLAKDQTDQGYLCRNIRKRGWRYAWDVVFNEWKVLRRMDADRDTDREELSKRRRFYSDSVVLTMMMDYVNDLEKHLRTLRNGKKRSCRGHQYVLFHCSRNNYRGLFVDEFQDYLKEYRDLIKEFRTSRDFVGKYEALEKFHRLVRNNRWRSDISSSAFMNAFKAVGGYYTLKDLIMFEGVRMEGETSVEGSLRALDAEMLDDLGECGQRTPLDGYKLLGLLKSCLGSDPKAYVQEKREKWHRAFEERRNARRNAVR